MKVLIFIPPNLIIDGEYFHRKIIDISSTISRRSPFRSYLDVQFTTASWGYYIRSMIERELLIVNKYTDFKGQVFL